MTKQQRTQDKQIAKAAMQTYKPSETVSRDKQIVKTAMQTLYLLYLLYLLQ